MDLGSALQMAYDGCTLEQTDTRFLWQLSGKNYCALLKRHHRLVQIAEDPVLHAFHKPMGAPITHAVLGRTSHLSEVQMALGHPDGSFSFMTPVLSFVYNAGVDDAAVILFGRKGAGAHEANIITTENNRMHVDGVACRDMVRRAAAIALQKDAAAGSETTPLAAFYDHMPFNCPQGKGLLQLIEDIELGDLGHVRLILENMIKYAGRPVLFMDNYHVGILDCARLGRRAPTDPLQLRLHCTSGPGCGTSSHLSPDTLWAVRESPARCALLIGEYKRHEFPSVYILAMPQSDFALDSMIRKPIVAEMRNRLTCVKKHSA